MESMEKIIKITIREFNTLLTQIIAGKVKHFHTRKTPINFLFRFHLESRKSRLIIIFPGSIIIRKN